VGQLSCSLPESGGSGMLPVLPRYGVRLEDGPWRSDDGFACDH
jgi:hypothetical protein